MARHLEWDEARIAARLVELEALTRLRPETLQRFPAQLSGGERQRVSLTTMIREAKHAWHGVQLHRPDWGDGSHSLAFGAESRMEGLSVHLIFNAYWEPLTFELPKLPAGTSWRRWIDTALDSPNDIVPWQAAPTVPGVVVTTGQNTPVTLGAYLRYGTVSGRAVDDGGTGLGGIFRFQSPSC